MHTVMYKKAGQAIILATIHRARVVTEWFDEHENDVNHMPLSSQSTELNPSEHLWEILQRLLRQRFLPPSTKDQIIDFLVPDACIIYDMVHWSCSGSWWPKALLRHFMFLSLYSSLPRWHSSSDVFLTSSCRVPYIYIYIITTFFFTYIFYFPKTHLQNTLLQSVSPIYIYIKKVLFTSDLWSSDRLVRN